jgi:hypothetical protein
LHPPYVIPEKEGITELVDRYYNEVSRFEKILDDGKMYVVSGML